MLVAALIAGARWREATTFVDSSLLFRTGQAAVSVEGFYPPSARNSFQFRNLASIADPDPAAFEGLAAMVSRDGATEFKLYAASRASRLCQTYPAICGDGPLTAVLHVRTEDGSWATASSADVSHSYLPDSDPTSVISSQPSENLYLVTGQGTPDARVKSLKRTADGTGILLERSKDARVDLVAALTLIIASIMAGALVWLATSPSILAFLRAVFTTNYRIIGVFVVWCATCYLTVFPAMFNSDTLILDSAHGYFNSWYGGAYYLFTTFVRPLGFEWIQAPAIALIFGSFLVILRTIDVSLQSYGERACLVLKLAFLAGLMFSPAIFATMFSQQRYFLVIAVAVFSLSLAAYDYLNSIRGDLKGLPSSLLWGQGLLFAAALLRLEYLLFAVLVLAGSGLLLVRRRFLAPGWTAAGLAAILVVSVVAYVAVEIVLPRAAHYDSAFAAAKYKNVSAVAMAKAYVDCDETIEGPVEEGIERLGGLSQYCASTPETFWWVRVKPNLTPDRQDELSRFNRDVTKTIMGAPWAFARERMSVFLDTVTQEYWQIFSRYAFRDEVHAGTNQVNVHVDNADRLGLVRERAAIEPLERAIPSFYRAVSGFSLGYTAFSMGLLAITILACVWPLRAYASALFAAAALSLIVPVSLLMPRADWGYLGIIPVWTIYAIPLAFCESHLVRRRKEAAKGVRHGWS